MHFCVSAARVGKPGMAPGHLSTSGFRWPRKIGTNWFMPAFVKSRFGASGSKLDEGTTVCCFDLKKSRNDWRISALVINKSEKSGGEISREHWRKASWKFLGAPTAADAEQPGQSPSPRPLGRPPSSGS